MKVKQSFGQSNAQKLGLAALLGCILVPIVFFALVKSDSNQFAILNLQLSIQGFEPLSSTNEHVTSQQTAINLTSLPLQLRVVQKRNASVTGIVNDKKELPEQINEIPYGNHLPAEEQDENSVIVEVEMKEKVDGNIAVSNKKESKLADLTREKVDQNTINNSINSTIEIPLDMNKEEKIVENQTLPSTENLKLPQNSKENQDVRMDTIDNKHEIVRTDEAEPQGMTEGNIILHQSRLECDFSLPRTDTCSLLGDIRIVTKSSTIVLASSSENSTNKIKPYARKWESPVMQQINEITIKPLIEAKLAPSCSINQSIPAVVFSTGGFLGNFFHDFTDVIVPLFVTSRQYQGEVQFLVTDFNQKWITKYAPVLRKLSNYEIINMDSDTNVHCYPKAHLGLLSHKVLGIDPLKTPKGYSMIDFKEFIRTCYNLNKRSTTIIPKISNKKPRLLMILRKGSRSLMNAKKIIAMARSIGYKVITAGPNDTKDIAKFSRVVNSCDVMMGVHGAGLGNMVFLPTNATLIQIVPWGGLKWACWHDFGEPAPDMGLNYVEYEIKEEESSLIAEYPRDHAVFTDPASIQKQGWNMLWSIFLDKQKVKLDVERFRRALLDIYQTLKK